MSAFHEMLGAQIRERELWKKWRGTVTLCDLCREEPSTVSGYPAPGRSELVNVCAKCRQLILEEIKQ